MHDLGEVELAAGQVQRRGSGLVEGRRDDAEARQRLEPVGLQGVPKVRRADGQRVELHVRLGPRERAVGQLGADRDGGIDGHQAVPFAMSSAAR